jgi:hypothetical protein
MGDARGALSSAAKVVEAEYTSPYLNHATMEPQTATAWFKEDGTLEVWSSTQNGEGSIAAAAEASGLALEKVEVHKMMLGGGFGRRGAGQDYIGQAVIIAKDFRGTPVKLIWSREEDMQHGYYRPASLVRMRAGLDADGKVVAMHTVIACPSVIAQFRPEAVEKGIDNISVRTFHDMTYTIPNQLVEYAMRNGHVPVGFWRAPGLQNSYYRECFIDEVALAAGKDPLEFRLAMLKDGDRNKGVLQAVAKAAEWGKPLPAGVHRGIAQSDGFGSTPMLKVVDRGRIASRRAPSTPATCESDMCVARCGQRHLNIGQLYEANTVKDGRIAESNFTTSAAQTDRDAEGRSGARLDGRLLGRPWRAGRAQRRACDPQRRVRRNGETRAYPAAEGRDRCLGSFLRRQESRPWSLHHWRAAPGRETCPGVVTSSSPATRAIASFATRFRAPRAETSDPRSRMSAAGPHPRKFVGESKTSLASIPTRQCPRITASRASRGWRPHTRASRSFPASRSTTWSRIFRR